MADTTTGNKDARQFVAIPPRMSPPTTGPGSHPHGLPVQNNNTSTTSTPTMTGDPEPTPTPDDINVSREREVELRAQSHEPKTRASESRTQPSRASSARNSQQPDNIKNSSSLTKSRNATPSTAPGPSTTTATTHDASITINALRQQIFVAEHHQIQFRYEAAQQVHRLDSLVRTTWDRATHLEANVHYLSAELEKANSYNATLNEHVRSLRKDMEVKDAQHKAALKAAKAKAGGIRATAHSTTYSTAGVLAAPTPAPTPAVIPVMTLSLNDARTSTLLEHNRTTLRSLRSEIRNLKTANKQVQDRLLELRSAPAVDARTVMQNRGVPMEVLREWSEVLLEKDREITGLRVLLGREGEAREQVEKERCGKCGPVVLVEDDDADIAE